jgi:hypothetical protein
MAYDSERRYRTWYGRLIRLHSRAHYERYGEGMEQTFSDLLRERVADGRGVFTYALWMCIETSLGIIKENLIVRSMTTSRTLTFILGALCLLFIPFFAMLFQVEGWDWHLFDYLVVGVLLVGFGVSLAYATSAGLSKRMIIGIGLALLFVALYVHVAVGIVDWLPLAGS